MAPFDRLGIGQEAGEQEIKRAYARLIRQVRPDEDPAGFQQLNDAYRACLALSSHRAAAAGTLWEVQQEASSGPLGPPARSESLPQDETPATDPAAESAALLARLHAQATVLPPTRITEWLQAQPELYSLRYKEQLSPQLVDHLAECPPLPPRVLEAVLDFFGLLDIDHRFHALGHQLAQLHHASRTAHPTFADLQFRTERRPTSHVPEDSNWGWRILLWLFIAGTAVARVFAS